MQWSKKAIIDHGPTPQMCIIYTIFITKLLVSPKNFYLFMYFSQKCKVKLYPLGNGPLKMAPGDILPQNNRSLENVKVKVLKGDCE